MISYSSHLIVIFDRSGSMGEPFQADYEAARRANSVGQQDIKILEAQGQLIALLRRGTFDFVTIIPFHSEVDAPITGSLPTELASIERRIRNIRPGDSTILAPALELVIKLGKQEQEQNIFVQYLIITDGLSHTKEQDIALARQIPRTQSIIGILIDPTEEGETHLNNLCAGRGLVRTVASRHQFRETMARQSEEYAIRLPLMHSYSRLLYQNENVSSHLNILLERMQGERAVSERLRYSISRALDTAHRRIRETGERAEAIQELIQDYSRPFDKHELDIQLGDWESALDQARTLASIVERLLGSPPRVELRLSLAYPKLLSKRFSSPFKITIYPPYRQEEVDEALKKEFERWNVKHVDDTGLTPGLTVVIKLSSSDIEFDEEVTKELGNEISTTYITGKPKETCHPGVQTVKLAITDKTTGHEYLSRTVKVRVVDFAFDHVSRPFLSKATSIVVGLAAVVTYILTLLGQIDKVFGFASGTAAGFVAAFTYAQFQALFRRPGTTVNLGTQQP